MESEKFLLSQIINKEKKDVIKLNLDEDIFSLIKKEEEILWARTSICTMSFWQAQKLIKVGKSFRDNNGLFSSYQLVLKAIPDFIYEYEIDSTSLLELKVHISIVDMPVILKSNINNKYVSGELVSLLKEGAYIEYNKEIEDKLNDLKISFNKTKNAVLKEKTKEQILEIYHVKKIEPIIQQKEMQVWSSKLDMSTFVNAMIKNYTILESKCSQDSV